ncbi:dihydrolipoyl dehydrogenase [Selenihalanaerobacter shriftii]|uniref:Dihydrolipoyl dehydrogenase n=1 Tax=Selenihalanaerobacter shriftii TaxID=142842 RepID=A0A1T4JJP2_9FIRM|nr:dihydrolipoyl dehydrogenase [Selenihalanaerobacter shriftii]SJZ30371.1 dihydrolipoamide dehydrogenase [Selenihalanaerobacter shriftii]
MKEYDIAVVGGGPGGYVAAIKAAQLGADVCLVEKEDLGGTCLNRGCIPTKALTASCDVVRNIKGARRFGIKVNDFEIDWSNVAKNKDRKVSQLVKGIEYLIKKNDIDFVSGTASFKEKNLLEISDNDEVSEVKAKNVIIATGSQPRVVPAFNYDGDKVVTSKELLELEELPESLLIIGAGVIGCEFASIFATVGVKITVVDVMSRLLPTEDEEISKNLARAFKRARIKTNLETEIQEIKTDEEGIEAIIGDRDSIEADMALVAIGRKPYTEGLNLDAIGLETANGVIEVNEYLETAVEGIYAIGDVTDEIQLAHVASKQGMVAVENILDEKQEMDYRVVPNTIFTHPEVASVGLNTQEAEEADIEIEVGKFFFKGNGKAVTLNETQGLVKIIMNAKDETILGGHIVGPHASDLIHEIALAIKSGLTVEELTDMIHAHPTLAEAVLEAAEDTMGTAIHG